MSDKVKFFLIIGIGALVITAGIVLLTSLARAYPDNDAMYYLFTGLSVLFFLAGVTAIIIWTSRLED
jgi:hypothetical protein